MKHTMPCDEKSATMKTWAVEFEISGRAVVIVEAANAGEARVLAKLCEDDPKIAEWDYLGVISITEQT